MTLAASATGTVEADPQSILEFVLDLERYRQVDPKIFRVGKVTGPDGDGRGTVKLWARMAWLPPAPDRQEFELERWSKLTFVGAARQPARLAFGFVGTVECDQVESSDESGAVSTVVTHAYRMDFTPPLRWVEPRLAGWLQRQVEAEVADLAKQFAR